MISKKDCVIIAVVGYLVLIALFIFSDEKRKFDIACSNRSPCIRFCCRNQETCKEKFLRENLKKSIDWTNDYDYNDENYKIMYGEPSCSVKSIYKGSWSIYKDGEVLIHDEWKTQEKYCLQDSLLTNGSVTFDLYLCKESSVSYRDLFAYFYFIFTILLMAAIIFVHIFFRKLIATISGKIEFCLVVCLMFILVCDSSLEIDGAYIWRDVSLISMLLGFTFCLFWMSVMIFDVWWTTRKGKEATDGAKRFKFYCFYIGGVFGIIFLWTISEIYFFSLSIFLGTWTIFVATVLMNLAFDVIILVLTATTLFRLSKAINFLDHSWFEIQKSRFWTNIQLLFILGIIWTVILHTKNNSSIFGDILLCYSAFLIFIIFATRKETWDIFSDNYRMFRNNRG